MNDTKTLGPTSGLIFNIMRYSTKDGPGLRTTVFLKGCPLTCRWCHNPESQRLVPEVVFRSNRCIRCESCGEVCPNQGLELPEGQPLVHLERCTACGACVEVCPTQARDIIGRSMTVADVMSEIMKDRPFYEESGGGVTFSGGEPLMQVDFLNEILKECRAQDVHTAVDTCGAVPWAFFERLLGEVNLFLYDLKIMDDDLHQKWTGVSNRLILENLARLAGSGANIWVRIPIIPGATDDLANIKKIGLFLEKLGTVPYIELLPYHDTGRDKYRLLHRPYMITDSHSPARPDLEQIATWLRRSGSEVNIGGVVK